MLVKYVQLILVDQFKNSFPKFFVFIIFLCLTISTRKNCELPMVFFFNTKITLS